MTKKELAAQTHAILRNRKESFDLGVAEGRRLEKNEAIKRIQD